MTEYSYDFDTYFSAGLSIDKLRGEVSSTVEIINGQVKIVWSGVESALTDILSAHVADEVPFLLRYANSNYSAGPLLDHLDGNDVTNVAIDTHVIIEFSVIPTKSTIDTLMGTYVEPAATTPVTLVQTAGENYVKTIGGDIMRSIQPEELIVSKNGQGNFTSVKAAVDSITGGATVVIRIYPGTYVENNPITLPLNCSLQGENSAGNTVIAAANSGSPLVILAAYNRITNLTFTGGTIGLTHVGSDVAAFNRIDSCFIINCARAIDVSGGYGSFFITSCLIKSDYAFEGIYNDGGSLILTETIFNGNVGAPMTYAVKNTNASFTTVNVMSAYYCVVGLELNNASTQRIFGLNIIGCGVACNIIADTGAFPVSRLLVGTINVESCTTDLSVATTANVQFLTAAMDDNKITANGNEISANFQNYKNGNFYQVFSGHIYFGNENINSYLCIGDNVALDNAVFYLDSTDKTDEFQSPSGSPVAITTESIYICHKTKQLYGIDIQSDLTSNPTVEYWDGAAWQTLSVSYYNMATCQFVSTITAQGTIYFDNDYTSTQQLLNGLTAHWIKITTGACSIENITLHGNYKQYNTEGHTRRCGQTRRIRQMPISGDSFFIPPDMDISTKYEIKIHADTGITIEGNLTNDTVASHSQYATTDPETFTYSATNVRCIVINYLSV